MQTWERHLPHLVLFFQCLIVRAERNPLGSHLYWNLVSLHDLQVLYPLHHGLLSHIADNVLYETIWNQSGKNFNLSKLNDVDNRFCRCRRRRQSRPRRCRRWTTTESLSSSKLNIRWNRSTDASTSTSKIFFTPEGKTSNLLFFA